MRTKLIIIVFLLIGLLFMLNWLGGRYLSSMVDRQLQQIADSDEQMDYHYQSLNINPAAGSLVIINPEYYDRQIHMEADKIRGTLTWADIIRILRNGSENPISQIHTFRISATSLEIQAPNSFSGSSNSHSGIAAGHAFNRIGHTANLSDPDLNRSGENSLNLPRISAGTLNLIYNGRLDELLEMRRNSSPPLFNHRINIRMSDINAPDGLNFLSESIPVLAGYHFPESLNQISFQFRYQAAKKTALLNTLRIQSPELTFRAGGELQYEDSGWPDRPQSSSIYYRLNAVTHEVAHINLPGIMGGFSMDTLSVNSTLTFDRNSEERHPLLLPGETSLYLGNIYWYPSSDLTDRFGLLFQMFDLSETQLPLRSMQSGYKITDDTIHVNNATLYTEPFDARIQMKLFTPPHQRPVIQDGTVTFIRTGTEFNEFIEGLENLFDIEFPRKEGQLYFEFSGDAGSPHFNFNL